MNSYEINIVLATEEDSLSLLEKYESQNKDGGMYLENLIPTLFVTSFVGDSRNFNIDSVGTDTNELIIHCYGTKYPSIEIGQLFVDLKINGQHGIKVKSRYDGDGPNDYYCIVNSEKCSIQKYNAYYKKYKLQDKKKVSSKTVEKKQPKQNKTDLQKAQEALQIAQQEILTKELNIGKDEKDKIAFVRLLIRNKQKREVVKGVFMPYVSKGHSVNYEQFCDSFNRIVSHEAYEVSWCYVKSINNSYYAWGKGPEQLIKYLSVVVEQGNYIYLGFELKGLDEQEFDPDKYRVEQGLQQWTDLQSLAFVLAAIDGVSKASIKYRPLGKLGVEYYAFYPDSGRESPRQILSSITKNYEWPSAW